MIKKSSLLKFLKSIFFFFGISVLLFLKFSYGLGILNPMLTMLTKCQEMEVWCIDKLGQCLWAFQVFENQRWSIVTEKFYSYFKVIVLKLRSLRLNFENTLI